jgi:hypothetical protein
MVKKVLKVQQKIARVDDGAKGGRSSKGSACRHSILERKLKNSLLNEMTDAPDWPGGATRQPGFVMRGAKN